MSGKDGGIIRRSPGIGDRSFERVPYNKPVSPMTYARQYWKQTAIGAVCLLLLLLVGNHAEAQRQMAVKIWIGFNFGVLLVAWPWYLYLLGRWAILFRRKRMVEPHLDCVVSFTTRAVLDEVSVRGVLFVVVGLASGLMMQSLHIKTEGAGKWEGTYLLFGLPTIGSWLLAAVLVTIWNSSLALSVLSNKQIKQYLPAPAWKAMKLTTIRHVIREIPMCLYAAGIALSGGLLVAVLFRLITVFLLHAPEYLNYWRWRRTI